MARNGQFNQAGDLAPRTGPYGTAFQAALPSLQIPRRVYVYKHPYGGWIGALVVEGVQDFSVVPGKAYNGALPGTDQPTIQRPSPYDGAGS